MTTPFQNQLLYIIGNGFDLHHRVPSSYTDFGRHVQSVDSNLHSLFDNYFSFEGNWADFEKSLAHLDVDLILNGASTYLISYSAEDWSDAYHHDYQYEIDRIVSALSDGLKRQFTQWACGLETLNPFSCQVPLLNLVLDAAYLSFNYTDTLQKLYGISPAQVLHIHNQAIDINSDLVLGHGVSPASIASLNAGANLEDQDVRVTEANELVDEYFSKTYKPTQKVISEHQTFFDSLFDTRCVCVLGHSLSEVDWPYFALIAQKTRLSSPKWIVSYYHETQISSMKKAFAQFGVPATNVKFESITNAHP